ncbi:MAG: energy-coupling factor transporter transmembrane protein EcfT [Kouleothrix sp.]|jgi:energy-coupling factor transport system permease protein|nr:energy-coupling factor transporter transmembrane protein EcfT [Kouleothrix sp.]
MIASFKYLNTNTPIHRLDPRTKIVLMLCAAFTAASVRDLRALALLLALTLVYYGLARLPWRETRAAWRFIFFFIFVLVGINTLILGSASNQPGALVLLRLPLGIRITWPNVIEALGIICRMLAGALMAIPLTFTIPPTRFGVAFRGMGLNDRIAFAIDLAIRLVPTYAENFRSTIDAQRARGFEFDKLKGGLVARLRRLAPLAVPVTMTAIVSGEDITNALDMRGFGLRPRTWLHARRLRPIDWLLIALGLGLLLGGMAWRAAGGGQLWVPPYPF